MRRTLLLAIALVAIPITAIAQDSAPTTPDGFVKTRVEKMGRGGDEIGVMMETLDSEGDLRTLAPRIERLVQWSQELPTLFPEGSVTAASEARPEVWSERAGFLAAAARFRTAVEALAAPAAANDRAAFAGALTAANDACSACHDSYRN